MGDDLEQQWLMTVDGIALRWSSRPGAGRPLLLINGLGGNIEMWEPLRRALVGRPTLAFDAPGTGGSATSYAPLRIDHLARLVAMSLDQLGISDLDVLGYSFGGSVAQALARMETRRVNHLVLVGSTCGWGGLWLDPRAVAELATPARFYRRRRTDRIARVAFGDPANSSFSHLDAARRARPPSLVGYYRQMLAIAGWSSYAWLNQIQQETLVLVGARDRAAPVRNSEILAARIPRAYLRVAPEAGHLLLMADEVGDVASEIARFLDAEPTDVRRSA
jgi:pimeloyl-ACP methyl ester carboxylesterase